MGRLKEGIQKKFTLFFWVILISFFSYLTFLSYAENPIDTTPEVVLVDIPKGTGFFEITDILTKAGVVKHKLFFYALALSKGATNKIKAGEYEISLSMSPSEIIDKFVKGKIKAYSVTFPEDITLKEISGRLASYKLINEDEFFRLTNDPEFIASLGIEGQSLEGYLYPDTYYLDRSMGTKEIIRLMVHQFLKKVTPEMRERARALGFTVHEFVTLASIIGKESGNDEEKPLISAVFHNRLKRGMKLQSDPTAVYDMPNFKGPIKRKHLLNSSPHNTYHISGLPPGPIANPGLSSLRAALYPAPVNYLYFVAKNDGTHYFSVTLKEHNEAIARYQAIRENKDNALKVEVRQN